jgi:hypothetical protein
VHAAEPFINEMLPFHVSENDGEVELDDVWFAYPSRPSHMILKVFFHNSNDHLEYLIFFSICVCCVSMKRKLGTKLALFIFL